MKKGEFGLDSKTENVRAHLKQDTNFSSIGNPGKKGIEKKKETMQQQLRMNVTENESDVIKDSGKYK